MLNQNTVYDVMYQILVSNKGSNSAMTSIIQHEKVGKENYNSSPQKTALCFCLGLYWDNREHQWSSGGKAYALILLWIMAQVENVYFRHKNWEDCSFLQEETEREQKSSVRTLWSIFQEFGHTKEKGCQKNGQNKLYALFNIEINRSCEKGKPSEFREWSHIMHVSYVLEVRAHEQFAEVGINISSCSCC